MLFACGGRGRAVRCIVHLAFVFSFVFPPSSVGEVVGGVWRFGGSRDPLELCLVLDAEPYEFGSELSCVEGEFDLYALDLGFDALDFGEEHACFGRHGLLHGGLFYSHV